MRGIVWSGGFIGRSGFKVYDREIGGEWGGEETTVGRGNDIVSYGGAIYESVQVLFLKKYLF